MQVYENLIRNNVERFLAGAFPIAKERLTQLEEPPWNVLVRAFLEGHGCASPYFRDIGEEFLAFLESDAAPEVPDFLAELCHYERVPTLLRRAEAPPFEHLGTPPSRPGLSSGINESAHSGELGASPVEPIDPEGDLLAHPVAVSPLAWPLSYRFPVHKIRANGRADQVRPQPTWLIAWRRADDTVGFMASNALTHRLLALLREGHTGHQALDRLAEELPSASKARIHQEGAAILVRLRDAGVLLGASARLEQ